MKNLLIYGASNPEVVKLVDAVNRQVRTWEIVGFFDDFKKDRIQEFMGYPILGGEESVARHAGSDVYLLNNVLTPKARKSVASRLDRQGVRYATLVSPGVDTNRTEIGYDCIISAGAQLGANTVIGNHVIIRANSLVNHDNTLGDYVFIGPGATLCGHVRVGEGAFIGAGAVIKNDITIQAWSFIGLGALVNRDVKQGEIMASPPARSVKNLIRPG